MNPPEESPQQNKAEKPKRRGRPPRNLPVLFQEEPEPGVAVEAVAFTPTPLPVKTKIKGRPRKLETQAQLQAFEYYVDLGDSRSLRQVAVKFGVKDFEVARWSKNFLWSSRVQEYFNKNTVERTRDHILRNTENIARVASLKIAEMTEPDPDNPGRTRATDKATVYGLKELQATNAKCADTLRTDIGIQQDQKDLDNSDSGNGKGKPGGVMVNVMISNK